MTLNISPHRPSGDVTAQEEPTLADVTERLMAEFGDQVDVSTVSRVVLGCRHDLQGSPVAALPELVERLARQRLLQGAAE